MKNVLLLLADGFEEIEAVTPIDILRRAGVGVTVAALKGKEAIGSHSIMMSADMDLKSVINNNFDMLILPGGGGGTANLAASEDVTAILVRYEKEDRYIAAICAAPTVLLKAGVGKEATFTSHHSVADRFDPQFYSTENVVTSGKFITSRSPGTAMDFSFELVRVLVGDDMVKKIKTDMGY